MLFEWDPAKAEGNLAKHGVSFEDAFTVFNDPLSTTWPDSRHSLEEFRFWTVGYARSGKLLGVVHTEREGVIRIISARGLMAQERHRYEQSNK